MQIFNLAQKPRALFFDIDSTLYTNAEYAFEQVDVQIRHFAKLRGISANDARKLISDYRDTWAKNHNGEKISLGNTLCAFGVPIAQSIEWRKNLIKPEDFLCKDEKLIQTLTTLAPHFKMIAVTNNPVLPATKTLQTLGVDKFFLRVIGLDTCGVSKPAKEPYLLASKIANVEPCECVSIGDRFDIDLKVPISLGMGAILVSSVQDVYTLPSIIL